ncbi:MAG: DUF190 domain-containing protein [Limnochordaceae bacterium]|nr:DUF190 domain-containing protein [Limnochordaceae bacterium]
MTVPKTAERLRIYIGETDRYRGQSLYHAIVLKAKELGLAGATVLRGLEGYGANSRIHTARILDLSSDLPIVVEIIDEPAKLDRLLPFLDQAVTQGCLITREPVQVYRYHHTTSSDIRARS